MKRPTEASLKRVTTDNLEALGAERLAQILMDAAQARPELKRRLRMELAARQGAESLALEIDKRLGSLATSRGRVGWRQRPAFVRELEGLLELIADRLAALDRAAAAERLWTLLRAGPAVLHRLSDKDGSAEAVFGRAAEELGRLTGVDGASAAAEALVASIAAAPSGWSEWLPRLLASAPPELAAHALAGMTLRRGTGPTWLMQRRRLASAAGDLDAYVATFPPEALTTPDVAADVGSRMLEAGRIEEAGAVLRAAAPRPVGRQGRLAAPDFAWETAWIDYLERAGETSAAQAIRWASFERTLSAKRLRAFTSRLADFDDVEAEGRAFAYAARHPEFEAALRLLVGWPALAEAGALILARPDEAGVNPDDAELWAGKLRVRQPAAAHLLLRRAGAAAFRRREFKTSDRLSAEADAIAASLPDPASPPT